MSFDLKIVDGDLSISSGDLATVEHSEKLVQDILKMLMTPINSKVFFPWYGSPISKSLIGSAFEGTFISAIATNQIRNSLETLKNLQEGQVNSGQYVSAREQIGALKNILINRSDVDPRVFRVITEVFNKAFTTVKAGFQVTL